MKNIYLIGMRGVGKTTVGKQLAADLQKIFIDMDELIQQKAGKPLNQIVHEQGWDVFRALEQSAVGEVSARTDAVVATGGGVLMFFDNAEKLKNSGKMILLTADITTIQDRLSGSEGRPSLTGAGFLEELDQIWRDRKDRYSEYADEVIHTEGKSLDQIVADIIATL